MIKWFYCSQVMLHTAWCALCVNSRSWRLVGCFSTTAGVDTEPLPHQVTPSTMAWWLIIPAQGSVISRRSDGALVSIVSDPFPPNCSWVFFFLILLHSCRKLWRLWSPLRPSPTSFSFPMSPTSSPSPPPPPPPPPRQPPAPVSSLCHLHILAGFFSPFFSPSSK